MLNCMRKLSTKVVSKKQIFFDTVTARCVGGTGGRGVSSFQMIDSGKYLPTGGNGGKGGDVYIRVNSHLDILNLPKRVYKAGDGCNGKDAYYSGKCMHGRGGDDLFIEVPIGTLVYKLSRNESDEKSMSAIDKMGKEEFDKQMRAHLGEVYDSIKENEETMSDVKQSQMPHSEMNKELLFDTSYSDHNAVFCVAKGGKGGMGNSEWYERSKQQNLRYWGSNRDRRLQATYYKHDENHNRGEFGEDCMLLLQEQKLAEIGLVGYPNGGKSTLLSKLTKTAPKVAAYPFTTLRPLVGYLEFSDDLKISIADIPGIISGAHNNRGLGLSFLRHIQRTKVLAYVIDVSDQVNLPNTVLHEIQKELLYYDEALLRKPTIIIANKMDVAGAEIGLSLLKECTSLPIISISAKNENKLNSVAHTLRQAWLLSNVKME